MKLCLITGYVPKLWRQAKVIFLPKPGKKDYTEPGSWRPISLTSFLLKTLERLVDKRLRAKDLCNKLSNHFQFAYLPGGSTEAALSRFVGYVERGMEQNETIVAALADISGAFNNITVGAMERSLAKNAIPALYSRWISFMLRNRELSSSIQSDTVSIKVCRGCPQGGSFPPCCGY